MADSTSPETSIKRLRIGANVLLQVFLWATIVLTVNYLSCRRYRQWDQTASKQYTLGNQTQQLLGSLSQNVTITALLDREGDLTRYMSQILDRYQALAPERLRLLSIDLRRDPTALADLRNRHPKLRFNEEMLLIEPEKGALQVIRETELVDREETALSSQAGRRGRILHYHAESAITSALLAAVQNRQHIVYLVSDKGGMRPTDRGDAGGVLLTLGKQFHGMEVRSLALGSTREVPADANAVVLLAPEQDLTGEQISLLFRDYWEKRHGGIVMLFDPEHYANTRQLTNWLAAYYGVKLEDDRILTVLSEGGRTVKEYEVPVMFMPDSPINKDLSTRSLRLSGQTSSLKLFNPNEDAILRSSNIRHTVLMLPAAEYWKERDFREPNVMADKPEFLDVNVAVAVEKGGGVDERVRVDSSRMVLVGNPSLLDADKLTNEGIDFMLGSVNWVSNREDLVGGIPAVAAGSHKVNLLPSQRTRLDWYAIRILPAAVFLLGCVVMFFRRR